MKTLKKEDRQYKAQIDNFGISTPNQGMIRESGDWKLK